MPTALGLHRTSGELWPIICQRLAKLHIHTKSICTNGEKLGMNLNIASSIVCIRLILTLTMLLFPSHFGGLCSAFTLALSFYSVGVRSENCKLNSLHFTNIHMENTNKILIKLTLQLNINLHFNQVLT